MMFVCPECFENRGLKRRLVEIRPGLPWETCHFHPRHKGIPIETVADIVGRVFRNNYSLGHYHPQYDDFMGDPLNAILGELTGADNDEVIAALVHTLIQDQGQSIFDGEVPFFSEEASYERTDEAFQGHGVLWNSFRETIVHQQRFFNDQARELLSTIFDGIHRQSNTGSHQPVFILQPGTHEGRMIRARMAENTATRKAIADAVPKEMGPPPHRLRKPGRMNPSGVSVFYGAYDLLTCIAELRPRVGSIVACAEFEITRPLIVLDMTRFSGEVKEPNLFAKDHIRRMTQWRFMQSFMHEIAQPISPDDEHLDYIPTQAVAEYLHRHHRFHLGGKECRIDAIFFRSAQHPQGKNVVLLGDAALVEDVGNSVPIRHSAYDEAFDFYASQSGNPPLPGLRLIPKSLSFHRVDEATFVPSAFVEPKADEDEAYD